MREVFLYQGNMRVYFREDQVDEAIEECYDDHQNNTDPADYIDYAEEFDRSVDVLDGHSWEAYKAWCHGENLNPSHASSLFEYFEELE